MESKIYKLVDKYLEGETTLAEEREIADYLHSAEHLPDDLKPLKAMFEATTATREITSPVEPKRQEPAKRDNTLRRSMWLSLMSGTAAAAILLGIGIFISRDTATPIYDAPAQSTPSIACHVNGKLITNNYDAMAETNRVLEGVMGDVNLAMAEIERLNIYTYNH